MMRVIVILSFFTLFTKTILAQKTREELEKERTQLRKEIDDAQKLLNNNKAATKENLTTLIILGNKAELQDRVVNNISKDINILDNNIYGIQRDINKYDKLLDTLRLEYAKSMVYAYKNRGNYEFLNFIFSADNFNDAVKRIAYLKSYRTFREMQGQNIIRTQELRRKKLEDLGVTKKTKSTVLESQTEEMKKLEEQKAEQDRIVANLKKQGKDINARIAEKQRQVAKVNAAVKAAIAKAIKEENARRKAAEDLARKKKADELAEANRIARIKKAEADKIAKAAGKPVAPDPIAKTTTEKTVTKKVEKTPEVVSLSNESIALNSKFESNRGILPWPVANPAILIHYGPYTLGSGAKGINEAVTISAPIGGAVNAVFEGEVIMISEIEDDKYAVLLKHGNYYTTYSNVNSVSVKLNQQVKTGQSLGRVAANLDGVGSIDFYTMKGNTQLNPEIWLRRR
jgi:murein hydrolase activator